VNKHNILIILSFIIIRGNLFSGKGTQKTIFKGIVFNLLNKRYKKGYYPFTQTVTNTLTNYQNILSIKSIKKIT